MASLRRDQSSCCGELWRFLRLACCSHIMLSLTNCSVVSALDHQVSYLRRQRRQSLLQVQHHDMLEHILGKSTSRSLSTNKPSLQKCYDTLDGISRQKRQEQQQLDLTRSDFVTFVQLLEDSGMSTATTTFSDLPAKWVSIFYMAACGSGQDCVGETPSVSLNRTGRSGALLRFFCRQALSSATTTASLRFEYVLRYDETYMATAAVTEQDIAECLETAAKHLLLDQVAQCSFKGSAHQRERRLTDRAVDHVDTRLLQEAESEDGTSSDGSAPTFCPYKVDVHDTRLSDFSCDLPNESSVRCILVQSTAKIEVEQVLEPYADDLRAQMVDRLRHGINVNEDTANGNFLFEDYLPATCQFGE